MPIEFYPNNEDRVHLSSGEIFRGMILQGYPEDMRMGPIHLTSDGRGAWRKNGGERFYQPLGLYYVEGGGHLKIWQTFRSRLEEGLKEWWCKQPGWLNTSNRPWK